MKKKIYLVEDDTDIREMIEYLLRHKQYNVFACATADLLRKKMETEYPDLIILDIMLPDGNGEEICRKLKSSDTTASIPVLLMSANFSKEPSANDFIGKPFDIDELLAKIQHLVN